MLNIHMGFKEDNPDDMFIYSHLQALGKKNRSKLIKVLVKRTIEQYEYLFKPKHAATLFAILERGSPIPTTPLSSAAVFSPYPSAVEKKPGKKRGPKPKNRNADGTLKAESMVNTTKQPSNPVTESINAPNKGKNYANGSVTEPVPTSPGDMPGGIAEKDFQIGNSPNKDFYERMSSFLEDEIYQT